MYDRDLLLHKDKDKDKGQGRSKKDKERAIINSDINAFLAAGGEIKQIPQGVSCETHPNYGKDYKIGGKNA